MKLDAYIENSLVSIAKGVKEAMHTAEVCIAPSSIEGEAIWTPQLVKFEVEVAASSDGSGGIDVLSLAELKAVHSSSSSHRITFEVPIHFNAENVLRKNP